MSAVWRKDQSYNSLHQVYLLSVPLEILLRCPSSTSPVRVTMSMMDTPLASDYAQKTKQCDGIQDVVVVLGT